MPPVAVAAGAVPLISVPRVVALFVEGRWRHTFDSRWNCAGCRDDTCAIADAQGLWDATLGPLGAVTPGAAATGVMSCRPPILLPHLAHQSRRMECNRQQSQLVVAGRLALVKRLNVDAPSNVVARLILAARPGRVTCCCRVDRRGCPDRPGIVAGRLNVAPHHNEIAPCSVSVAV